MWRQIVVTIYLLYENKTIINNQFKIKPKCVHAQNYKLHS